MVDSYNEKKENGEVENETPTTGVKAEHLHLVDELMLEMIYGFIEEATATTKDWKLAARIGGPDGKIVYFGSKERKDAALNAGTHFDVDKKLNAKAKQPKNEPVAGAGLFDKDYKDKRDTEKAALNTKSDSGVQSLDSFLSGIADTANTKKQKETIKTSVQAMNDVFDKLVNNPKNPHAKSHKKVQTLMNNIFNGKKLTDEEKIFLQQFVRIAEPTAKKPDTAKYYIAVEPGDFKGNKRAKIAVGGKSGSTPTYAAFRQFTERGGLIQMSASTFGTKLTTANQTFVNEKGQTKTLNRKDGKPFASVQTNKKTGQVEAVTIGGTKISRLNENEKNITPEEKKFRQRNNRNIDEYSKAIKKGDLKFIDMDEGVSPDTPKNRVIVIQGALNGMAVRLRNLANKEGVTDERVTKLIDEMQVFSQRDPNKNPEQWFKDLNSLMSSIANDEGEPSLKECWANYAEVYSAIVEMHDGGKGTQNGACALLPESTTLETVDIITINTNGVGERKIVTLNGKSVKKGVGGASALTSKTEKSTYKDDPTGSKKEAIIELSESHDDIYRMKLTEPMNEHVKLQKEYRNNLKDKAKSLGVSNQFISEIENSMKEPNSGWKSINAAENAILEQRKKAGLDVSTDTMKKIRMRLENYYMYGHLAHEAYNTNVDVQDFSNDSILSQPGDKGGSQLVKNKTIKIDSSNGVTILAYPRFEFNVGTWGMEGRSGNAGAGRFHNELKR